MMKKSAGILLYKSMAGKRLYFLVHPGGPFWKNKDAGSWSIPKGEPDENEDVLEAAIREFLEETGILLAGPFIELNPVKLKSGKKILAWACEKDIEISGCQSNSFEMEWPPRSGKMQSFPEVDQWEWFEFDVAIGKINERQIAFLEQCSTF